MGNHVRDTASPNPARATPAGLLGIQGAPERNHQAGRLGQRNVAEGNVTQHTDEAGADGSKTPRVRKKSFHRLREGLRTARRRIMSIRHHSTARNSDSPGLTERFSDSRASLAARTAAPSVAADTEEFRRVQSNAPSVAADTEEFRRVQSNAPSVAADTEEFRRVQSNAPSVAAGAEELRQVQDNAATTSDARRPKAHTARRLHARIMRGLREKPVRDGILQMVQRDSPAAMRCYVERLNIGGHLAPEDSVTLAHVADYLEQAERDMAEIQSLAASLRRGNASNEQKLHLTRLLEDHAQGLVLAKEGTDDLMRRNAIFSPGQQQSNQAGLMVTMALSSKLLGMRMDMEDIRAELFDDLPKLDDSAISETDKLYQSMVVAKGGAIAAEALKSVTSTSPLLRPASEKAARILNAHAKQLHEARAARLNPQLPTLTQRMAGLTLARPDGATRATPAQRQQAVTELHRHWHARARQPGSWSTDKGWLPLSHDVLSQKEITRAFIEYTLEQYSGGREPLPPPELMDFIFDVAQVRALEGAPIAAVNEIVAFPAADSVQANDASNHDAQFQVGAQPAGRFIANYFPNRYPDWMSIPIAADGIQWQHVPNLAVTNMSTTQDDGVRHLTLGLRHGALDPTGITPETLKLMPPDDLLVMLKTLYIPERLAGPNGRAGITAEQVADEVARATLPGSRAGLEQLAGRIRDQSARVMAQELAVSALALDRQNMDRALDGQTVNLDLDAIGMMTPKDSARRSMIERQAAALRSLEGQPMILKVRDTRGSTDEIKEVRVNIRVRNYNFAVDREGVTPARGGRFRRWVGKLRRRAGWRFVAAGNNAALTGMIGPSGGKQLGGACGTHLNILRNEIQRLEREEFVLDADLGELRTQQSGPQDEAKIAGKQNDLASVQAELAMLHKEESRVRTLGEQIKDIWTSKRYRDEGNEPFKMVSRITLLSHLLGRTPLMSCQDGVGRTGYLDAEVKYLTGYGELHGTYPEVDTPPTIESQLTRGEILLKGGGLEMERVNRGLPVYGMNDALPSVANAVSADAAAALQGTVRETGAIRPQR